MLLTLLNNLHYNVDGRAVIFKKEKISLDRMVEIKKSRKSVKIERPTQIRRCLT
jgi:hypothetical protein